ncbi:MAG: riboflavin synthase [Myxococcales bacterium]|nr:riboflavin synthase [Myxococcales bacterium]
MFTGLVEAVGSLKRRERRGPGFELWIEAPFASYEEGESIAVSGACLTVTHFQSPKGGAPGGFAADVSQETVDKTSLGNVQLGGSVNLERSLQLGGRLGGHLVSGHVDGLAKLESKTAAGESIAHVFSAPAALMPLIAAKGSVTLDGVSLTVNRLVPDSNPHGFEVMLIPHTLSVTTLGKLSPGSEVNLEVDLLARYVVRYLESGAAMAQSADVRAPGKDETSLLQTLERAGLKL